MKVETRDKFIKVGIVGRLAASCADELKRTLDAQIAKCPNVLCDLGATTYVDSAGLIVLVGALKSCKAADGTCRLARLRPAPRIVFDITKVARAFEICDTVEVAEMAFA